LPSEQILLPHLWRRYLSVFKVVLGLICFVLIALDPGSWPVAASVALAILFVLDVAVLLVQLQPQGRARLFFVVGTLFFLIAVTYLPARHLWFASAYVFYLTISATMLQGWVDAGVFTAVLIAYLAIFQPPLAYPLLCLLPFLGTFACLLALQRKSLLDRLSHFSRQVVAIRAEADNVRQDERKRIAADFHDGPLQSFISFQMRLEIVRKMLARDVRSGVEELEQLQELCRSQVNGLRSFVRSMRPLEPGRAGLVASVMRIVEAFQRDSGILASLSIADDAKLEDVEADADTLQVIREALNNVQKHSNAARVLISVRRTNGHIDFTIKDDGRGFPFSGAFNLGELEILRMGPASIKQRIKGLNGEMSIESRPGAGARLELRIPI
jgi:signal transduction histidine kinase